MRLKTAAADLPRVLIVPMKRVDIACDAAELFLHLKGDLGGKGLDLAGLKLGVGIFIHDSASCIWRTSSSALSPFSLRTCSAPP